MNWKLLNVNINIGHQNYAQCKFYVYVPPDVAADAAYCSMHATIILAYYIRKEQTENLNAYQTLFK